MVRWLRVIALVLLAACPSPGGSGKKVDGGKGKEITLFFTAELRGQLEPCGCNSDPLGDIARIAALLADARQGRAVAWFDGGSTLYDAPKLPAEKLLQAKLGADLLAGELTKMGLQAAGLGATDLADGKDKVRPARQAANVPADAGLAIEAPKIVEVGGVKVGVFGVIAPDALAEAKATDPAEAARAAIKQLRGQGAQVVVGLAYLSRAETKKLAREAPGADVLLIGRDAPDPSDPRKLVPVEQVGETLVVQPYNRGQSLVRVDLMVDPAGGPFVDAIGEERAKARIAELDREIADLQAKLAEWAKDAKSDPAFVDGKKKDLAALEAERAELQKNPLRKPAKGGWLVAWNVLIKRGLRCDASLVEKKHAFDKQVGEQNLAAAKDEQPEAPAAGKAAYTGDEECGFCHKTQLEFWKTTHHAQAWATLDKLGKQYNRDCIGCHVTGWMKPGGAVLAKNEHLRNVQCETCHGPGSLHVDADGKARETLVKTPPEAMCIKCHSPEHSDTFVYDAYLRDVTGKGHGEALRKSLGDGVTGHELRSKALELAGKSVGEGCGK